MEPMAQGLSGIPARASVAPDARGATQIARWLTLGALVLLAALFFFPMVWMVLSSFKTDQAIFASPFALPETIDLSRWVEAWEVGNLGRYALNSAIVTGVSVTLILVMGAMAAFAFSRFRFAGRGLAMGLFALGLLLPLQAYFIAQSNLFTRLAITDTRWALMIPYTAMGLPLAVYLLKVFLDALPEELSKPPTSTARAKVACSASSPCRSCARASRPSRSSRRSRPGTSSCSRSCTSRTTTSRRSRRGCSRSPAATRRTIRSSSRPYPS